MFDNGLFLLQIAVIVGFSRLIAWAFRRFGQPQVVGEMAAGIALGPTLFGLLAPSAYYSLFPPGSLGFLNALSHVGLAIFIFLVGVRVDFGELRRTERGRHRHQQHQRHPAASDGYCLGPISFPTLWE